MHHPTSPAKALRRRALNTRSVKAIEVLEDRIAPAVSASVQLTVLVITGDNLDNVVALRNDPNNANNVLVDVGDDGAGTPDLGPFAKGSFSSVAFDAQGGSDTFIMDYANGDPLSTGKPFTYNPLGAVGADTLVVRNLVGTAPLDSASLSLSSSAANSGTVTINGANLTGNSLTGGFAFVNVTNLMVAGQAGADIYTLDAGAVAGRGKISGTSNASAQQVSYTGVANLTLDLGAGDGGSTTADVLTVKSLSGAGLRNLTVNTGAGNDTLHLLNTVTSMSLPAAGGAFTFNGGGDSDTLAWEANTDFTLTDTSLSGISGGPLQLSGVEVANLTGGGANNLFDVSGWNGTGSLTGGSGTDKVIQAGEGFHSYGLNDSTLNRTAAGSVQKNLSLSSIEQADITALSGSGSLTIVGGFTGVAFYNSLGGNDLLVLNYVGATLPSAGNIIFNGVGGASDRVWLFGHSSGTATWTPSVTTANTATVTYGGATISYNAAAGGLYTSGAGAFIARPAGGASNYTLAGNILSGSSPAQKVEFTSFQNESIGALTIDLGGHDLVPAADSLTITGLPARATSLSVLTGSGDDSVSFSGVTSFAGYSSANIDTGSGSDSLSFIADANLNLTASTLTVGSPGSEIGIAGIETANLTGGASANVLTVDGFAGTANLNGGGSGADIFNVTLSGSSGTVNVTGGSNSDALNVFGTANDDSFNVTQGKIALDLKAVNYDTAIEAVTVDGLGGNDPLTISLLTGAVANATTTFNYVGGGQSGDALSFLGNGAATVTWTPGAANAGTIAIGGGNYTYATAPGGLNFTSLAKVLLQPAAGADNFTLTGASSTLSATGQKAVLSLVPSLEVNFGNGDGPNTPVSDIFTVNGIPAGITSLDVKLGAGEDQLNISAVTNLAGITFIANGGATGPDTISYSGDVDITLTNDELQIPGGSIGLSSSFEVATLVGGALGRTYTVSGWSGSGSIDAAGGNDTLVAATNIDTIGLSDTEFTRKGQGTFTLTSIDFAELTGGAGANAFTIASFTGDATVTGGGGNDSLTVTATSGGVTLTLLNATSSEVEYATSTITANAIGNFDLRGNELAIVGDFNASATWTPAIAGDSPSTFDIVEDALHRVVLFQPPTGVTLTNLKSLTLAPLAGSNTYSIANDSTPGFGHIDGNTVGNVTYFTRFSQVESVTFDLGANDPAGSSQKDSARIFALNNITGLQNLAIKTGEGDDDVQFGNTFETFDLPVPGGAFTIDLGTGTDDMVFRHDVDLTMSNPNNVFTLGLGDGSSLTYSGIEIFHVRVDSLTLSGVAAETVTWEPAVSASSMINHQGPETGRLLVASAGFATRTIHYHLDVPGLNDPAPLSISDVHAVQLDPQFGANVFTLAAAGQGTVSLSGTAGSGNFQNAASLTNIEVLGIDLGKKDFQSEADKLIVSSLGLNGLTTLTVSTGGGDDTLELTSSLNSLELGTNPGEVFSFDAGDGGDTLKATSALALNLKNSSLALGSSGPLTYQSVENFVLDGGANGAVNYTGTGNEAVAWAPDAVLTNTGSATFLSSTLSYKGQLGIFTTASLTLTTLAGADAFTIGGSSALGSIAGTVAGSISHSAVFAEIPTIVLELGMNDGVGATGDSVTVSSLAAPSLQNVTVRTGGGDDSLTFTPAIADLKNFTFDAGTGADTVTATADVSMNLGNESLSFTDNVNYTASFGTLTMTGSAVETIDLTGGAGANRFRVTSWAGTATIKGLAGNDTFDLTGGFAGTGSFQGGEDNDTFILQNSTTAAFAGALGGASLDGGNGSDTIQATANLNFTIKDDAFQRTIPKVKKTDPPAQTLTNVIAGIERAIVNGGASSNILNASQFSGVVTLSGEGGVDNLIASKGGGDLFGFHANPTTAEIKSKLYTRDNFFASSTATTDAIHATIKAGNILSFRYSPVGVNYTIPNAAGGEQSVGGGLKIQLAEGKITAVEGSRFDDRLTGNKAVNFLIGAKGNDVLRAVGFDYLFGGPGRDSLQGVTPFRYQDASYPIPNSSGVSAVRAPAPFPRPETSALDSIAAIIAGA